MIEQAAVTRATTQRTKDEMRVKAMQFRQEYLESEDRSFVYRSPNLNPNLNPNPNPNPNLTKCQTHKA